LGLWLGSFVLGFLVWEALERKRITEGKRMAEEGLIENLH
jgi:hypothetical protein